MKIYFLIALLFAQFSGSYIFSQENKFHAGVNLGLNTSQFDGDTYGGYHKIGLCGGLVVKRAFNEKTQIQFEINYSQKGARKQPNEKNSNQYKLNLDYIEVPVVFGFKQKKLFIEAGLGAGALVNSYEESNFLNVTGLRPFNSVEFSFNAGITYPLISSLYFNWRFTYSILPVRPHASGVTYRFNLGEMNNVIMFSLKYYFGKKNNEQ